MKTVRWGIIGCGNVTEVKSGPAFQKASGSQLVAVMRRDAVKAQDYAQRHGVPKWYSEAQALIDDPEVDAVYIATPPHMHHLYTLAAAQASKPVYVEKPMASHHCSMPGNDPGLPGRWRAAVRCLLPAGLLRFLKAKELVRAAPSASCAALISGWLYRSRSLLPAELPWRFTPRSLAAAFHVDLASHTSIFSISPRPVKSASQASPATRPALTLPKMSSAVYSSLRAESMPPASGASAALKPPTRLT
jgi:hypothetical protein